MKVDDAARLKQRTTIDLGQLCMISKIHIKGKARFSKFNIYVAQSPEDTSTKVAAQQSTYYRD